MSLEGLNYSEKILCILCLLLCSQNVFADNKSPIDVNTVLQTPEFILDARHIAAPETTAPKYNTSINLKKQAGENFYKNGVPTGFAAGIGTTNPTIDKINTEAAAYIQGMSSYTLIQLTGALPEGAVQVIVNGKKYYYIPAEGSDIKTLQNLANIGTAALKETPDDNNSQLTYVVDGKYYTYDTDKLPGSAYNLTPASTKGDTSITLYETAANGTLTPVYYNVELNKTEYGTGDTALTFGWEKNASDRLEFKQPPTLPVGQKITYKYDSAKQQNGRIENTADRSGSTIAGMFINQKIQNSSGTAYGGAINNTASSAKLGDITADFIMNYADSSSSTAAGGGIFNRKTIGDITGDFAGNYARADKSAVWGGAILNWSGTIGNLTGDFVGNNIVSEKNAAKGAVIHNDTGKIGNITGNFIGNYAKGASSVLGGAIYNVNSAIKDITGNFIGNYAVSSSSVAANHNVAGGGIYNDQKSTIGNITGDFIGNYLTSGRDVWGGAILNWNNSTVGNITGDFIGNYIVSSQKAAKGGAIHNDIGTIGDITGNFIGNYAIGFAETYGGAIYNRQGSTLGNITGDFIGNYAKSTNGVVWGGAILNWDNSIIGDIEGDFIGNYAIGFAETYGGAIYNRQGSTLGNITGDFIGNYAKSTNGVVWGGAILNWDNSIIGDIEGDFIGNYAFADKAAAKGGAVHNDGIMGNIVGDFIGNYATGVSSVGGALYNHSKAVIKNITGNFTGNYAKSIKGDAFGGAIINGDGTIDSIAGTFRNNYAITPSGIAAGGAIYSHEKGLIKDIAGDFIDNYAKASNGESRGGAIYNMNGTINNIKEGKFEKNYALASDKTAAGGAIYNLNGGNIKNIENDFIGNHANSTDGAVWGGAILNWNATLGNIKGNFKDNYVVSSNKAAKGGAIHNDKGNIGNITGEFEKNYASGVSTYGGAIYNKENGVIGDINGNFKGNYAKSTNGETYGGAIYNRDSSIIGHIISDFSGNYAVSGSGAASGGAIYNYNGSTIVDITGSFIGNYAKTNAASKLALGGAVYTTADMNFIADSKNIEFTGNYTQDKKRGKINNAIFVETSSSSSPTISLKAQNNGTITFNDQIDGGFVSTATIDRTNAYNLSLTGNSTGKIALNSDVINANVTHDNVTLLLGVTSPDTNSSDVFKQSDVTTNSGIVDTKDNKYTNYNFKSLNSSEDTRYNIDISLSKDEQKADTFTITNGGSGVIYLSSINVTNNCGYNEKIILQIIKSETMDAPELKYDSSKVLQWAKPNMTSEDIIAEDFGLTTTKTHNDSIAINGLLDAFPEWAELNTDESKSFTFLDNTEYTVSRDITALNGTNLTINGSNNTLNINNKNIFSDIKDTQEVSLNNMTVKNAEISNNGTINLDTITLDNSVNVNNNNTINISGNSSFNGKVKNNSVININNANADFNNEVTGANGSIKLENSVVNINDKFKGQSINQIDGTTNINNIPGFVNNSLTLSGGNVNISDLGLNNLHFNNLNLANGNINIDSLKVDLAHKKMGRITADDYGNSPQGTININEMIITSDSKGNVTPILFADSAIKNNVQTTVQELPLESQANYVFSPIYRYSVNYNNDGKYGDGGYFVFRKGGLNTKNPSFKFNPAILASPVSTQVGGYLTQLQTLQDGFFHMDRYTKYPSAVRLAAERNNRYAVTETPVYNGAILAETEQSMWAKPYTSFESVHLKGGVNVSTTTYGSLYGGDTDLVDLGHGFKGVISTFVGYNGSQQSYDGISISQNGGSLGLTGTLYKGNFFTGLTASTGASTGDAYTFFGHDDFTMLTAGIANKTGYNWEINEGKLIVQPSVFLGYTFVNTFDYTNCAGVKIDSDPLHAITIAPGVKFIGNLNNGWQPYTGVDMVWNIMDKTNVMANDVRLPHLSVKPYVQYGVGVQKSWGERFTAFFQSMIRNGGRSGVVLTGGFRWALGKKNLSSPSNEPVKKKYIKNSENL